MPFLASVARYLITSAGSLSPNHQQQVCIPSPLRKRVESVIQTALNSGISNYVLIAACLMTAMGLQSQEDTVGVSSAAASACISNLSDPLLELVLQQCFVEACLTVSTDVGNCEPGEVRQSMSGEAPPINDLFAADNRSEGQVLESGTVSPTGSSMSIANFLVPSKWSAGPSTSAEVPQQSQIDLPLTLHELNEEQRECMVCSSRDRAALLAPCGHIVACQQCTQLLKKCILCRQQATSYREVRIHDGYHFEFNVKNYISNLLKDPSLPRMHLPFGSYIHTGMQSLSRMS